ncbi:universal stress protein [Ottowia caeni]|uniref:universal stress protein n=1 Tax=Ottowia caeni TaxID=2870339 RepID=UPI001E442814|nr:universal stress protein [Ottowia caeni]
MYKKILVPLDGSDTSNLALDHAIALARLSGGSVVLFHVIEELAYSNGFERPKIYIEQVRPRFIATSQTILDEASARLRQEGVNVETLLLESGGKRASELIAEQAKASGCDIVILGTHGRRGVERFLMGSDAEQVARIASVPVMLVRG